MQQKKVTFLFPGQGAQYAGMGHDFYREFPIARHTFEEADDLLKRRLSDIIFGNDEKALTETKNSQPAIYITSIAILRTLQGLIPLQPIACAGLSLGEYTALTAASKLSFQEAVPLVQARGRFMHEACDANPGTMSVILGLDDEQAEEAIASLNKPNEVWCANFNCPGQVVISGTIAGVAAGAQACLEKGAKRVIPLQVHGAFHSGLMKSAQDKLAPLLQAATITKSDIAIACNVTGTIVESPEEMKKLLEQQVTSPVRWQKAVRALDDMGTELFIEIGCGKTLSGMNKRIGVKAPTWNLEKVENLKTIEMELS